MSVKVKDVVIGEGKPKVCLPIVGRTFEEVVEQASSFKDVDFDVVELRIDFFEDLLDVNTLMRLLKEVRSLISQPILFTYRSTREGGEIELSDEDYEYLCQIAITSSYIDMIDVELLYGDDIVMDIVDMAHGYDVKVVMSNHDFKSTPDDETIISRIEKMVSLEADLCKVAYMPESKDDVIRLLNLTYNMSSKIASPLITMSMGDLGILSRVSGSLFGCALTFGCKGKASAPGQINVDDLNKILEVLG